MGASVMVENRVIGHAGNLSYGASVIVGKRVISHAGASVMWGISNWGHQSWAISNGWH